MDIVSLNYLDFLNGQNQNLKRSCLVASFLISDIYLIYKKCKIYQSALVKCQIYRFQNLFSKFVLSDYSSEENGLYKDMLNLKIKRHLAWTNCVCFIATLSFFSDFRKSIVLSANPVNRAEN